MIISNELKKLLQTRFMGGVDMKGARETRGLFYGWWVVLGCALAAGSALVTTSIFPALFPFASSEFGWTAADLGKVATVYSWVVTFAGPVGGIMVDRVGARWTFSIGAFIVAVGFAMLTTVKSVMEAVIWYGLAVALGAALQVVPLGAAVARRWFFKRAGLAIGAVSSGGWLAVAVLIPVLTMLSAAYGWRPALLWFGIVLEVVVAIYAVVVVRENPASMGLYPDGAREAPAVDFGVTGDSMNVSEALKSCQFWLLTTVMFLTLFTFAAFAAHLPTMAVRLGATPAQAGSYVSAQAIAAVVGAWIVGGLGDRFGKRHVSGIGLLAGTAVFVAAIFVVKSPGALLALTVIFGFLVQVPFVLVNALFGDLFGLARLGTIMMLAGLIQGALSATGPAVVGALAEVTGSYALPMGLFAACYFLGAVILSFLRPTRLGILVR